MKSIHRLRNSNYRTKEENNNQTFNFFSLLYRVTCN